MISPKSLVRISLEAVKTLVEELLLSMIFPFSEKHLRLMIDNDWTIIASIVYAMKHRPNYPKELSPEEVRRLESRRIAICKITWTNLLMIRQLVARLPRSLVERYLNKDYAMKYFRKKIPWVVEVIEKHPRGEAWFEKQIEEVREFIYRGKVWK